jgi:hypothetical protein
MNAVRLLMVLIFLTACNPQQGQEGVQVNTGGIFNPISLQINGVEVSPVEDLGEYLIGTGKQLLTFTVRNNSFYPITDLKVEMDAFESFGFSFQKTEEGKALFPGASGTCSTVVAPGGSCTIVFEFETNIKGQYEKDFTFSYKNLVESADRNIKLIMLAGNPGSLIFEGEKTNFHFGDLIGLAKTPVTERDDPIEYTQNVKVINAGDLRARNIAVSLSQSCFSKATKSCPDGQDTAYTIEHDCPAVLKHNEFCTLRVKYTPKNQDLDPAAPSPALANVRYDSVMRLDYQSSALGTPAALNGYVTTTSANIQAVFETSIETQSFEGQVVVGNRQIKVFRINNRGYREGKLRKIVVRLFNGNHVASCVRDANSEYLNCFDENLSAPVTQSQYPFFVKDKDNCFDPVLTQSRWIAVDDGCQFEFMFQPSVTYMSAMNFEYELFAEYDSNWKGNQTIRTNQLHTVTAQSLHAARLVPVSISFNNTNIPQQGSGDTVRTYNVGRLALQSPSNFRRRPLVITFENQGGVSATAVTARDGANTNIPQKEINPVGVRLGPLGIKHYEKSLISTSFCTDIAPGMRCSIITSYAPIHTGSEATNVLAAFDVHDPVTLIGYKRFLMQYKNGALFSDGNFTTISDIPEYQAEARYMVDMVEKGLLASYAEEIDLNFGTTTFGNEKRRFALLENIGIANVSYIPWTGEDLGANQDVVLVTPTPSEFQLYDADYDCRDIIDFAYRPTDTLEMIQARSGTWDPLPPSRKCLLAIETRTPKRRYTNDATSLLLSSFGGDLGRFFQASLNGSQDIWEPIHVYWVKFKFSVNSYDSDVMDPSATNSFKNPFGKLTVGPLVEGQAQIDSPAKLFPVSPRPLLSAMLYRQPVVLPNLLDENNNFLMASATYPNLWYFGDSNFTLTSNLVSSFSNPNYFEDIMKGFWTKNIIPTQIPVPINHFDYDYVYYIGTYPVNSSVVGSFRLANSGQQRAQILSRTFSQILPAAPAAAGLAVSHAPIPATQLKTLFVDGVPTQPFGVNVTFNPTLPGFHASELRFIYRDGSSVNKASDQTHCFQNNNTANCAEREIKILLLGEAMASPPTVDVSVADYQVDVRDSQPPLVSLLPEVAYTPGMAEANSASPVSLEYVKIASPGVNDGFARKRIYFRNPSLTTPVEDFKIIFRESPSGTRTASLNDAPNSYVCLNNTLSNPTFGTLCQGTCSMTTLAPGDSCYVEIRYQPNNGAMARTAYLTVIHKLAASRFMHRNVELSLFPRDPAMVILAVRTPEQIRTSLSPSVPSQFLPIGDNIEQIADPMVFDFSQNSGQFARLAFFNQTTTRASFLASYHKYLEELNGVRPALSTVPSASDYNERIVNGIGYTTIFLRRYTNGSPRIRIMANRACLVGDDEAGLLHIQKGFNNASLNPCFMIATLHANSNYMGRAISNRDAADMDLNHVNLPYYNSLRSSQANNIRVHFKGSIRPNGSILGASTYSGVQSFNTTDRQIRFSWTTMNPKHPALGSIVGYRVYFSTTSTALNNIYTTTASFRDFPLDASGIYQFIDQNLVAFRYYFYKIATIRFNPAYTHTPNPFNLSVGRFISDAGASTLWVPVPGNRMFYEHTTRSMIERYNFNQAFRLQSEARSDCENRTQSFSRNGSTVSVRFRLINQTTWNIIEANPTLSESDIYGFPIWLDMPQVNTHSTLLAFPEYNPNSDSGYLDTPKLYYMKRSGCGSNCPGLRAVGRAFIKADYDSFIDPTIRFAGARCFIPVPNP